MYYPVAVFGSVDAQHKYVVTYNPSCTEGGDKLVPPQSMKIEKKIVGIEPPKSILLRKLKK